MTGIQKAFFNCNSYSQIRNWREYIFSSETNGRAVWIRRSFRQTSKQKSPEAGAEGTDEQEVDDERPLQRLLLLTFMLFLIMCMCRCLCVGRCTCVQEPEEARKVSCGLELEYECLSGAGPLQEQYAL